MSRFPFQNLSEKLIVKVLNDLAVLDLFYLSLCSSKARNIVIHHTDSLRPMEIEIYEYSVSIDVVRWKFLHPRDKEHAHFRNHHYQWIQGRQYLLCKSESGEQYCLTETPQLSALYFTYYLMCLFRSEHNSLSLKLDDLTMESLLDIQSWTFLHGALEVSIYGGAVSPEEMYNFLNNYSPSILTLWCYPPRDFVYEKPISAWSLTLGSAYWFTRQNLLSADCDQIRLESSTLTGADINAFIHQWLISDNQDFEYLEVTGREKGNDYAGSIEGVMGYEQLDMEQVLEGLETMPGSRKRANASRYDYVTGVPYENGWDLRRRDGKLATILEFIRFQDQPVTLTFLFVVWLHPNPFAP